MSNSLKGLVLEVILKLTAKTKGVKTKTAIRNLNNNLFEVIIFVNFPHQLKQYYISATNPKNAPP